MNRIEDARLLWQRSQADLQQAITELGTRVADNTDGQAITSARLVVAMKQEKADFQLQRYITYLGNPE
jgi:hypothetical protein